MYKYICIHYDIYNVAHTHKHIHSQTQTHTRTHTDVYIYQFTDIHSCILSHREIGQWLAVADPYMYAALDTATKISLKYQIHRNV